MQLDKLLKDPLTDIWSQEDKQFFKYVDTEYEPMLIEKGLLPSCLCERIYGGHSKKLAETDPVYRRYQDMIMELVDYKFCMGQYSHLDINEEEQRRMKKRKQS